MLVCAYFWTDMYFSSSSSSCQPPWTCRGADDSSRRGLMSSRARRERCWQSQRSWHECGEKVSPADVLLSDSESKRQLSKSDFGRKPGSNLCTFFSFTLMPPFELFFGLLAKEKARSHFSVLFGESKRKSVTAWAREKRKQ